MKRPIFIVGTGRCGSTIFYKLISHHPDLCWHSTLENRYPDSSTVKFLSRILNRDPFYSVAKGIKPNFKPAEIWNIWEKADAGFVQPYRPLDGDDVSERKAKAFRKIVEEKVRRSGGKRFITKLTGWSRIPYLKKIFPNAVFVHVLRDGRAVVNSLLHVDFWSGWEGVHNWRWGFKEEYLRILEEYDESFAVLAALEWKILVDEIETAGGERGDDEFITIKYEDLVTEPTKVIKKVCSHLDLDYTSRFDKKVKSYGLKNMNYKWKQNLSKKEKKRLNDFLKDHLKKYGYLQ